MIRHMIFWNLAEENADRVETERFLKETFAAMVGAVPGLRAAHIGFDQGLAPTAWASPATWTAWRPWPAYQDYPPHVAFKRWAKVHLKDRCCVDLEVAE